MALLVEFPLAGSCRGKLRGLTCLSYSLRQSRRRGLVLGLDQDVHHVEQARPLVFIEGTLPWELREELAVQPRSQGGAFGGEDEVLDPAVGAVGFALDERPALELVGDDGDERSLAAEPLAKFAHGDGAADLGQRHRDGRWQGEVLADALGPVAQQPGQFEDGVQYRIWVGARTARLARRARGFALVHGLSVSAWDIC